KDQLPTGKQITDLPPRAYQQPAKSWIDYFNLNLIGKDRLPVGKQIYVRPELREPHVNRSFASNGTLNIPPPATRLPFNQYDWPLAGAWAAAYYQTNRSYIPEYNPNLFPPGSPIPPVPPPTPPEDKRIAYNAGNEWQMLDRIKEPGPVGWR